MAETLHADDAKEIVDEEDDNDGRAEAGVEDDGGAEHVAETFLHAEQRQESKKCKKYVKSSFVRIPTK